MLTEPRLVSAKFPSADPTQGGQIEARIRAALAAMEVKRVPLASIVQSLEEQAGKPAEVALDNTPPRIFVSTRAASLVVFDGEPVQAPVANSSLSVVVNTNWDCSATTRRAPGTCSSAGSWMAAPDAKGPACRPAPLPPAFAALPADANFANVRKQIPGRPMAARTC